MNQLIIMIILPIIVGLLLFIVPEKYRTIKGIAALIISIITFSLAIVIYRIEPLIFTPDSNTIGSGIFELLQRYMGGTRDYLVFNYDNLTRLITLFISLFAFLVLLYSIIYIKEGKVKNYYPYFLVTLGCSYGAVFSDNLLLFLFFWGILGISLYKLIYGHDEGSSAAAKKTLILIGASDSIMIVGIAIVWKITGTLSMSSISVQATDAL
jgi:NADH:ubiquinone oxidoreductase subunit 5 (subunit L)/multisubunit Na+/H+ antiporter MnhA subunit